MATVLRDAPHRRLMGSAGRARVEAEFSLFTMVRRYEQMYVELAMSRIAPRRSQSSESSIERLGAA
jgi:hypothetical protein